MPKHPEHRLARFTRAVLALSAITVGIPAALVAIARILYKSANPIHGLTAPWRWTAQGMRRTFTHAVAEDQLITSLCRALLTIAWGLTAVIVATIVVEVAHQVRDRQPSRHVVGLGWSQAIARNIAAGLLVIATLTPARTAQARPLPARAVATLNHTPTPATATSAADVPALPDVRWTRYLVRPGDSVYAIAERLATSDPSVATVRSLWYVTGARAPQTGHSRRYGSR